MRNSSRFHVAFLVQRQLFTQKEILGGECGPWVQAEEEEAHSIVWERQQRTYERHEATGPVRELCHRQGVPLRDEWLSLAIIPVRKFLVQLCFAPSAAPVICGPTRV
jgi:hypothetical protein